MTISSINSVTPLANGAKAAQNNSAADTSSTSGTGSSQDVSGTESRFLTLLVSQLRNQDPLNPMDNAQITSQIAQINTVGGIQKLNTTMNSLMQSFQSSQTLQATNLVGRGVLAAGSQVNLSDTGAMAGVSLAEAADNVTAQIMDANGKVVKTINLGPQPAGSVSLSWDGSQDQGTRVPNGQYHLSVSASQGGQPVEANPLQYGSVEGVSLEGSGVAVQVGGIGRLSLGDLVQVLN